MTQQVLNAIFIGSIYALFAVGYTLVFGVLDVLNLAHSAVFPTGRLVLEAEGRAQAIATVYNMARRNGIQLP